MQSLQGACVFRDERASDAERYKLWTKFLPDQEEQDVGALLGLWAMASPDGLRWFRNREEPVFPYWADTHNTLVWDPDRRLWSIYQRYYAGTCGDNKQWSPVTRSRRARRGARMESKDLVT